MAWGSQYQPTIALSTTEAEYMALTRVMKQILWMYVSQLHPSVRVTKGPGKTQTLAGCPQNQMRRTYNYVKGTIGLVRVRKLLYSPLFA